MTKTKWIYTDSDWTYEIYFVKDGKLLTTHPNDKTKENDSWEQNDTIVTFFYNDKYSIYNGKLLGHDTIIGTGKNQNESWEFKMMRKRKSYR